MSDIRQPRITQPTAKLINNGEKAPLTFQRAAVAAKTARLEAVKAQIQPTAAAESSPSSSPLAFSQQSTSADTNLNEENDSDNQESNPAGTRSKRHQIVSASDSDNESSIEQLERKKKKLKGKGM